MELQFFETQEQAWTHGSYTISTERQLLDVQMLWEIFREEAYWAKDIEFARFDTAIRNSLPFGVYAKDGSIAGFCRVVSDGAMFAYLRDVLILAAHRGQGLGTGLSNCALDHPDLRHINYWLLRTADAHGVYSKLGFTALPDPETFMIRRTPRIDWS
ncbi:hypothetical protein A6U97_26700 [Agrobacterium tumefaciens]|uniref:GNAT family N-acetyltransferase n=1 Tax=Agrobacterium tumefaciens TaxID=358 RepID=UPI00081010FC|nr:hypothetical protein A6U97_26700 [Agrobacterium tumefaciens]